MISAKVETAYMGLHYGLYEWQSLCYACGLPPEMCSCPRMPSEMDEEVDTPSTEARKLRRALCEPGMHYQTREKAITQTTFERFGGDVGPEEAWTQIWKENGHRTHYPTLPALWSPPYNPPR